MLRSSLCLSISLTDAPLKWSRLIRVMKECVDAEIRAEIVAGVDMDV